MERKVKKKLGIKMGESIFVGEIKHT